MNCFTHTSHGYNLTEGRNKLNVIFEVDRMATLSNIKYCLLMHFPGLNDIVSCRHALLSAVRKYFHKDIIEKFRKTCSNEKNTL